MDINTTVVSTWLAGLLWPFFRIGAFLLVAPIVGTQLVPARIRIILSVLITLLVAPNISTPVPEDVLSLSTLVITVQQLLIGLAMGFVLQILLQMFVVGGQIIAMKMGLGFASMVDPSNGVTVTVVSQFHLMLATLLFIAMNGHLVMIEILAGSFTALPVGAGFIRSDALWSLAGWGSWMFAGALLMALPAVVALLIINCSIAVITRAAPQLNIFSVGFPLMLVIGLCIIWVSVKGYLPHFEQHTREALDMMSVLVKP